MKNSEEEILAKAKAGRAAFHKIVPMPQGDWDKLDPGVQMEWLQTTRVTLTMGHWPGTDSGLRSVTLRAREAFTRAVLGGQTALFEDT